jgi:2-polyprenyl-3-methyl-5-hydroxy-6-metoxy-1,4-benzoquinol methylase
VQPTRKQRWQRDIHEYDSSHLRLQQVAALAIQSNPASVFDVGCGLGTLRGLLPGITYGGCDFIDRTDVDFPFYQCDLNETALPNQVGDYDVVTCSGILEYLDDLPDFLSKLHSKMKPGANLVATYFNMNHASRVIKMLAGHSFGVHPDWRGFYSPAEFLKIVKEANFQITEKYVTRYGIRGDGSIANSRNATFRLPPYSRAAPYFGHQILIKANV